MNDRRYARSERVPRAERKRERKAAKLAEKARAEDVRPSAPRPNQRPSARLNS